MSFRNPQGTRRRSTSMIRNNPTSPPYNRPRSLNFFDSNSNIFSPYGLSSPTKPYSPTTTSSFNNVYTSNYTSPYFSNGYRTSLTIPTKTLNNVNYSVRQSRPTTRTSSFNREKVPSRSHSAMGSRSISLTSLNSLNSEGYVSGTDKSSNRSSRLGSAADIRGENGEIDYKKLYEQAIVENDRLRDKLRKSDEELRDTKKTLERINTVTSKNSLSELEKREKRAMERKLSEMEEELKQLQKLKAENERLRAENRALTRVVSKLTNSANK